MSTLLTDVKTLTWPQRMTSLFILACMGFALFIIVGLMMTISRTNTTTTATSEASKPVTSESANVKVGVQPEKLHVYTHNWLALGARLSIKNPEGKVLWISLPQEPESDGFWGMQNKLTTEIPRDFDMAHGYSVVVHTTDGNAYRYNVSGIGTYYGEASFYLHVCGGSKSGLTEPLKLRLFVNWYEDEFSPEPAK